MRIKQTRGGVGSQHSLSLSLSLLPCIYVLAQVNQQKVASRSAFFGSEKSKARCRASRNRLCNTCVGRGTEGGNDTVA